MADAKGAYLDSNAVIRFIESSDDGLLFLFEQAANAVLRLVTSELTLAEVLVTPLRENDDHLRHLYEEFLVSGETLEVVPVHRGILRRSAEVRASLGNKGPDAIHIATAVDSGCVAFVSSDRRLRLPGGITQIEIEALGSLDGWP